MEAENLTEKINAVFKPELALVVYKNHSDYYIESHPMTLSNGRNILGAGIPMTEETIQDMVEFFKGKEGRESMIKGEVPESVLYCDWGIESKILVWYNPPVKRKMLFTKELAIPNGYAWQPGLVFMIRDNELSVFATICTGRPKPQTVLFRAPYHNVSDDGSVCLGSARVAKPRSMTYNNILLHYSQLFWASEFSHLAGNDTPINGNLNTYWKQAIKSGKPFDNSVLINGSKKKELMLKDLFKDLSK